VQMIKQMIAVAALAVASSSAIATPVTFDFTGSLIAVGNPLNFSQDGLNLSVSSTPGTVNQVIGLGLGVSQGFFENPQVDGSGVVEALDFMLSEAVQLLSVGFTRVGSNDDANISDGSLTIGVDLPNPDTVFFLGDIGSGSVDVQANGLFGSLFSVGAIGSNDEFRVSNIVVERVAEVSEPATLALLGLGLLGLLRVRRQR